MRRFPLPRALPVVLLAPMLLLPTACTGGGGGSGDDAGSVASTAEAETCMVCHNGSQHDDYAGSGLENPHPFPGAATLQCTTCHGGNPRGTTAETAHVPPPPEIGDEEFQERNATAYFNRLTLTGIDKFDDYVVDGQSPTRPIDYLQFVNPGDLRVVIQGRPLVRELPPRRTRSVWPRVLLATETGHASPERCTPSGVENQVTDQIAGLYEDTAADLAFRAVVDPDFVFDATRDGCGGGAHRVPRVQRAGRPEGRPTRFSRTRSTTRGDLSADDRQRPTTP